MRLSQAGLLAACAPSVWSSSIAKPPAHDASAPAVFLVETAPGETKWVNEDGKQQLRRNGQKFMDITDWRVLGSLNSGNRSRVTFPEKCVHREKVRKLAKGLDKASMMSHLKHLSSYWTRHYDTTWGLQASDWIMANLTEMVTEADASDTVSVQSFPHKWKQHSVVATIPGQTNSTIVIGAHLDSTTMWGPYWLPAPGADDDGSGTVTIMEVFRALLQSRRVVEGKAQNTIEFHWYSAEEGGLLGSQDIFHSYAKQGRDVKAMLQQDMTGYVQGTLDAGQEESVGVIHDFVHPGLTDFIKTVIETYCSIPWVKTKCGYACSDHASASKAGYPSAFVIESAFENSNKKIHTPDDLMSLLSFDHMLQHARMTLGLVYELAFHEFDDDDSEATPEL